jgi:hypothetical protein
LMRIFLPEIRISISPAYACASRQARGLFAFLRLSPALFSARAPRIVVRTSRPFRGGRVYPYV